MDESTNKNKICGICCLFLLIAVVYFIIYPPPEATYVSFDNGFNESFEIFVEDNFMNKDMELSKGEVSPHSMKEIYLGAGEYRIYLKKENGELVELNNITLTKGKYIYNIGRKNSYYLKTCEYQVGGGVTFSERVEYIGKETLFDYPEADYGFDQPCPGSITVPKGKRYATQTKLIRETNPWPLTPAATVIKNSLLGYWNFNEGSGEIAHDLSGNNNNGTIYGAVWAGGRNGKALSFDGENDYVEIPDSTDLQFSDAFSVDLWILMNNFPSKEVPILFKGSDNIHRSYNYRINADIDGRFVLGVCSPTKEYYWYSKAKIKEGKWIHLVLTSDGSVVKFFIDGNFDSELKTIASYDVYNGYPIRINWNEKPFNGIIDEVRIYNYALTEDEIKAAAN